MSVIKWALLVYRKRTFRRNDLVNIDVDLNSTEVALVIYTVKIGTSLGDNIH